jgi:D-proline reductase (dithiol) PrdB
MSQTSAVATLGTMATPVDYLARSKERYDALGYPPYRWALDDSVPPWQALSKPLNECRIGLVSSGGAYVIGQEAFHFRDDISYRTIDTTTAESDLRVTHFAYDTTDARRDPNCVLPLRSLRTLVEDGTIGSLAPSAFSFVGGIYSSRRCREVLAPRLVEELVAQECDAVLLVPV